MRKYLGILIFLITSLSITGISYIDGIIWDKVLIFIGMTSYFIVGILFSLKIINSKTAGSKANIIVFIILLILAYWIYRLLMKLQLWIESWHIAVKIIVPIILIGLIIWFTILVIKHWDDQEIS